MDHATFCNPFRADFFLRFVNVLSAFVRITDFDPVYPVWIGRKILLNRPRRTSSCYFQNRPETHPLPRSRYFKGQFIVDTALHTVQLLIMRIIPSENDGFVLVLFDFSFLDKPLFLCSDTLQQSLCRLVRRVLRYQLALDCLLQDGLF